MNMNDETTHFIELYRAAPAHAIAISGPKGIGLEDIAAQLTENAHHILAIHPDTSKATPAISVAAVRELYDLTRSKTTAAQYIIIHDAEMMTAAAQGAFLKLLEEPGQSIHFILTSHHYDKLLPTIRSRLQHHRVKPLSSDMSQALIASLGITEKQRAAQLLFIADGLPAELERLARDDDYFQELSDITTDAKSLLQAKPYDKLVLAHQYRDDRQRALLLVQAALRIVRTMMSSKPSEEHRVRLEQLLRAEEHLSANGNIRLVLARLVLQ